MAWAKVQSTTATSTSPAPATLTKAFASNVVAGNRIFVLVGTTDAGSATGSPGTPTDTVGSTYTLLVISNYNGSTGKAILYTAVAAASGANTVSVPRGTVSSASGSEIGFSIMEYSGLDTSAGTGCLDRNSTGSGTASPISCGTTAATTAANQLALACVCDWGQSLIYTAPTGFALDSTACVQNNATTGIAVANKTSANSTAETGSFPYTITGGTSPAAFAGALIAVIKLAGTAAATPKRRVGKRVF